MDVYLYVFSSQIPRQNGKNVNINIWGAYKDLRYVDLISGTDR